jgi:hypothetical protein
VPGKRAPAGCLGWNHPSSSKENTMPVILWLLGVPLVVVLLLMFMNII